MSLVQFDIFSKFVEYCVNYNMGIIPDPEKHPASKLYIEIPSVQWSTYDIANLLYKTLFGVYNFIGRKTFFSRIDQSRFDKTKLRYILFRIYIPNVENTLSINQLKLGNKPINDRDEQQLQIKVDAVKNIIDSIKENTEFDNIIEDILVINIQETLDIDPISNEIIALETVIDNEGLQIYNDKLSNYQKKIVYYTTFDKIDELLFTNLTDIHVLSNHGLICQIIRKGDLFCVRPKSPFVFETNKQYYIKFQYYIDNQSILELRGYNDTFIDDHNCLTNLILDTDYCIKKIENLNKPFFYYSIFGKTDGEVIIKSIEIFYFTEEEIPEEPTTPPPPYIPPDTGFIVNGSLVIKGSLVIT